MAAEPAPGLTAQGRSHEVERLFLVPRRRARRLVVRLQALLNMPQGPGNQCRFLSAGENEGTVWPKAKKCPSEAVARAGENEGTVWP